MISHLHGRRYERIGGNGDRIEWRVHGPAHRSSRRFRNSLAELESTKPPVETLVIDHIEQPSGRISTWLE